MLFLVNRDFCTKFGVYPGHVVIYGGDTGSGNDIWSARRAGGSPLAPLIAARHLEILEHQFGIDTMGSDHSERSTCVTSSLSY